MNDDALADYRANRDAYFGEIRPVGGTITDPHKFFEWLMQANEKTSRASIIGWIGRHFPPGQLEEMLTKTFGPSIARVWSAE